eukprot:c11878_g1_i1.p1 GENE.c11878_g1_i1~~c11878_g1_i1.p1  ORF type:complete len:113 (+),score=27.64 c11878_g1_i1:75-413(+)
MCWISIPFTQCAQPLPEWPDDQVPDKIFARRIDIRVFPMESYYTGLLYFTGSDELNKHMRVKAIEQHFHLSEYELSAVGETGTKGDPLPVTCERDIFDYLGMEYLEPHQRSM